MEYTSLPSIAQLPLRPLQVFSWTPETERAIAAAAATPLGERLSRRRAHQVASVADRRPTPTH